MSKIKITEEEYANIRKVLLQNRNALVRLARCEQALRHYATSDSVKLTTELVASQEVAGGTIARNYFNEIGQNPYLVEGENEEVYEMPNNEIL
jgi:hypothetical protein